MSTSYKSVGINELQKAFGLAHKASQNPDFPIGTRNVFRAIAHQIWEACGEGRSMPAVLPADFPGTAAPSFPKA